MASDLETLQAKRKDLEAELRLLRNKHEVLIRANEEQDKRIVSMANDILKALGVNLAIGKVMYGRNR